MNDLLGLRSTRFAVVCCLSLSAIVALPAQAQSAAETRLRDQLRQTTLALRDMEDQNTELKQKLAEAEQKPAAPAPAAPANSADSAKARRLEAELRAQTEKAATLQKALDQARGTQEQWQTSYAQTAALAKSRDADAKKFEADAQSLGERVQRCERDNAQLSTISEDLLQRYKNKGLWRAIGDSEPLTGLQRVQLEKLAQDYHSRIVDAGVAAPAPSTPSAPQ